MARRAEGCAGVAGVATVPGRPEARSWATPAAKPDSHCSVAGSRPSTTRSSNSERSRSRGPSGSGATIVALMAFLAHWQFWGGMLGSVTRPAERPGGYRLITRSGGKEIDGLGRRHDGHVPLLETEHAHP